MTTVPLYTYKLLNSPNQLLNHLAQQVRIIDSSHLIGLLLITDNE